MSKKNKKNFNQVPRSGVEMYATIVSTLVEAFASVEKQTTVPAVFVGFEPGFARAITYIRNHSCIDEQTRYQIMCFANPVPPKIAEAFHERELEILRQSILRKCERKTAAKGASEATAQIPQNELEEKNELVTPLCREMFQHHLSHLASTAYILFPVSDPSSANELETVFQDVLQPAGIQFAGCLIIEENFVSRTNPFNGKDTMDTRAEDGIYVFKKAENLPETKTYFIEAVNQSNPKKFWKDLRDIAFGIVRGSTKHPVNRSISPFHCWDYYDRNDGYKFLLKRQESLNQESKRLRMMQQNRCRKLHAWEIVQDKKLLAVTRNLGEIGGLPEFFHSLQDLDVSNHNIVYWAFVRYLPPKSPVDELYLENCRNDPTWDPTENGPEYDLIEDSHLCASWEDVRTFIMDQEHDGDVSLFSLGAEHRPWMQVIRQVFASKEGKIGISEKFDGIFHAPLRQALHEYDDVRAMFPEATEDDFPQDALQQLLYEGNIIANDEEHCLYLCSQEDDTQKPIAEIPRYSSSTLDDMWTDIFVHNCCFLCLDPDVVSRDYLMIYQEIGEAGDFRCQFFPDSAAAVHAKELLSFDIYLPPRSLQDAIVTEYRIAEDAKQTVQAIHDAVCGRRLFPELGNAVLDFSASRNLPQPLASALYVASCETEIAKQNKELLNYFEACAQFVVTVLLSLLQEESPEKFWGAMSVYSKYHAKDKCCRFDFGTWTTYFRALKARKELYQYFGDSEILGRVEALLTNTFEEIEKFLEAGRNFRNGVSHGGRWTDRMDEMDSAEYIDRVLDLNQQLLRLFSNMEFLYVKPAKKVPFPTPRKVLWMQGPMPRLRPAPSFEFSNPEMLENVEIPTIFIYHRDSQQLIRLLPLLRYGMLADMDSELVSACYAQEIDNITPDTQIEDATRAGYAASWAVQWKSYDCGAGCGAKKSDQYAESGLYEDGRALYELFAEMLQRNATEKQ